jgi:hypothetical protein
MQSQSARQRPPSRYDRYDAAALLLLAVLVFLAILTFGSYGISNDEPVQQRYGELIIAYYTSGFTDRGLFKLDNLYLYGGLFDVVATLIANALGVDVYATRHLLCAFTGIGGIAAVWASARLIAGPRAGLLAAALLAVSGVWYGAMFNHTKDVTFAAAMMGAIYWLLRATRDLPRPRLRDVLLLGVMLGAALGLRAMGLIFGIYLGVAILMQLYAAGLASHRERLAFIGRSLLAFSPGLAIAYLIMIAAWPWAALGLFNPVRALFAFSQFNYEIRDLFAGGVYRMDQMPRWYLPTYIAIKVPLILLAGAAVALLVAAVPRLSRQAMTPRARYEIAFLIFVVAFPVAAQVITRGPIFSGMRHFTFVVPPLAVLAAIGLEALIGALSRWRAAAALTAGGAIAASLLWNASILVRLHPHEYLFYNALVGGLQGAAGRYATDYWFNSMPEAVEKLEAFLTRMEQESGQPRRRYTVTVCAEQIQFEHEASDRMRWTEDWEDSDFVISPTHMNCDRLLEGKVVATVERFGVVISVVKDLRGVVRPAGRPAGS